MSSGNFAVIMTMLLVSKLKQKLGVCIKSKWDHKTENIQLTSLFMFYTILIKLRVATTERNQNTLTCHFNSFILSSILFLILQERKMYS